MARMDKFGNPYVVVGCKDKKGKGFPKGFVEIGRKLYKLEPSISRKPGVEAWIRVTEVRRSFQGQPYQGPMQNNFGSSGGSGRGL